jgi:hypothetical protein
MNCLIKYLNRIACNNILVTAAAEEATKGTSPTLKMSCGETLVVVKSMRNGTMLAGMATNRQFNNIL